MKNFLIVTLTFILLFSHDCFAKKPEYPKGVYMSLEKIWNKTPSMDM